jgi:hypothetical protein
MEGSGAPGGFGQRGGCGPQGPLGGPLSEQLLTVGRVHRTGALAQLRRLADYPSDNSRDLDGLALLGDGIKNLDRAQPGRMGHLVEKFERAGRRRTRAAAARRDHRTASCCLISRCRRGCGRYSFFRFIWSAARGTDARRITVGRPAGESLAHRVLTACTRAAAVPVMGPTARVGGAPVGRSSGRVGDGRSAAGALHSGQKPSILLSCLWCPGGSAGPVMPDTERRGRFPGICRHVRGRGRYPVRKCSNIAEPAADRQCLLVVAACCPLPGGR